MSSIVATYRGNVTASIRGRVVTVPSRTPGGPRRHLVAIAAIYVPISDKTHAAMVPIAADETRIEMRHGVPYLTEEAMTERFESESTGTIEGELTETAMRTVLAEPRAAKRKPGELRTPTTAELIDQIRAETVTPGTIAAETVTAEKIAADQVTAGRIAERADGDSDPG